MAFFLEIILSTVTVAVKLAVHVKCMYLRYVHKVYEKITKAIDFKYTFFLILHFITKIFIHKTLQNGQSKIEKILK